jgi:hypothetical protein
VRLLFDDDDSDAIESAHCSLALCDEDDDEVCVAAGGDRPRWRIPSISIMNTSVCVFFGSTIRADVLV